MRATLPKGDAWLEQAKSNTIDAFKISDNKCSARARADETTGTAAG